MGERKPSNWRDHLTEEEKQTVAEYDALQAKIQLLRDKNKPLICDFKWIQNRAIQRAKYKPRAASVEDET